MAKSVGHFRLQNEHDILRRFQNRTPYIRPLIDKVLDGSSDPTTLILQYLDDDILHASNSQRLTHPEVKYIAQRVLKALLILHDEGFVHTSVLHLLGFLLYAIQLIVWCRYQTEQCVGQLWPKSSIYRYPTNQLWEHC